MKVVLAPDKFKGSLSAPLVAAHLATGIHAGSPDTEVVSLPVADGGDGFLDAALAAGYQEITVPAEGPTGKPILARYGERDRVAVIELADTAGLQALPDGTPAPMTASSYGTGLVIRAALDAGCRSILIGLGGSACTDGGAGLLEALGATLHGAGRGGGGLLSLTGVDLSQLHPALPATEITVASDVDNPLLGDTGAAAVYGPQKGASPEEVALLDTALAVWARHLGTDLANAPGAGAAGGVGYGLMAALGATMRPGIEIVLDMTDFDKALADAQLVVTGEGSLDEQTLHGKAVAGVAARARAAEVPVFAVAGRSTLDSGQLRTIGITSAFTLADIEPDLDVCMTRPGPILERIGRQIAQRVRR
ncbi:glycerate kinase [Kibdelosporangium aridum]|uniref:glycerate kinase n=1 Tax=Kibdelosporangium aridum TaxID=2030 RepID=UPI00068F44C4